MPQVRPSRVRRREPDRLPSLSSLPACAEGGWVVTMLPRSVPPPAPRDSWDGVKPVGGDSPAVFKDLRAFEARNRELAWYFRYRHLIDEGAA